MSGIFKKTKPKEEEGDDQIDMISPNYIDLAKYGGKKGPTLGKGHLVIKVAEIAGFEDLRELSNLIYEGNILILDFTSIANDELALKRTLSELKRLVADTGGDIAGISQNLLMIAPKTVAIDKQKIRRTSTGPRGGYGGF
jgi:uncharacterized protein